MTRYHVFNGDADGLCALQQLRLVDDRDAVLVTGVKRDVALLRHLTANPGDEITVLDISLHESRADLRRLLNAGASVRYFDHHHAGIIPHHPQLETHIREAPHVCTSSLVDEYLGHRYSFEDLVIHPTKLAEELLLFNDPIDFARNSTTFPELAANYEHAFKRAQPGLIVLAGAALGFLLALTSVGAGALGVVMLAYLYPYRLTPSKLVGTDIAHATPLTLVARLGHMSIGNVDFRLLGGLLVGSIPGIVLGSCLSIRVGGTYVRNAIAAVFAVVGVRLLMHS